MPTPMYVDEPADELDTDIGEIEKKEREPVTVVGLYDNLSKDELIDKVEFYKGTTQTQSRRADWLKRRLETLSDDDEYQAAEIGKEYAERLRRMEAKGGINQTWETMSANYCEEEAARLRLHFPRRWNAIRQVFIKFFKEKNMPIIEDWEQPGELLDMNSQYAVKVSIAAS